MSPIRPGHSPHFSDARSAQPTERVVRLVDEDPELFAGVDQAALARLAPYAVARAIDLPRGRWDERLEDAGKAPMGLLVLRGLLVREGTLGREQSVEILGPGDPLRPWVDIEDASVMMEPGWYAIDRCLIALLDHRFGRLASLAPAVLETLLDRHIRRIRWLEFQLAVSHMVGLEHRLELVLRHFADRWGRVTAEGTVIPYPFSHELLAKVTGGRRPSVSTALSRLSRTGSVVRLEDGSWLVGEIQPVSAAG
jgi:CRP/FNR family cyclic AMP-dependent transcriptional regulator